MTPYETGFLSKCAEFGVDGEALLKTAWPSLADKARAGVPGAKERLEAQRKAQADAHQKMLDAPTPPLFNVEAKAWFEHQARKRLAAMPPEERQKFLQDMWGHAIRTRVGIASLFAGFGGMGLLGGSLMEGAGEALASKAEGRSAAASLGRGAAAGGASYGIGKGVEAVGKYVVAPAYRWAAPRVSKAYRWAAPKVRRAVRNAYLRMFPKSSIAANFAGRAPASGSRMSGYVYKNAPDDVAYFYDDLMLPLKRKSGLSGKPGVDYDASYYRKGFYRDVPIKEDPLHGYSGTTTHYESGPRIKIRPGEPGNVIVHELQHARNGAVGNALSGTSNAEMGVIHDAFGFTDDALTGTTYRGRAVNNAYIASEEASTLKEHQFRLMNELKHRLGRKPTLQEYEQAVYSASTPRLQRWREYSPNVYQSYADASFIPSVKADFSGIPDSFYIEPDFSKPVGRLTGEDMVYGKLPDIAKEKWFGSNPDAFYRALDDNAVHFDSLLRDYGESMLRESPPKIHIEPRKILQDALERERVPVFPQDMLESYRKALLLGSNANDTRGDTALA